jgi:hypothetical protein
MWLNLAAAQGNEMEQDNKDIIEERMSRTQIAEAQRLSRPCRYLQNTVLRSGFFDFRLS